ncbi:MAG TPA: hypothetical protein VMT70_06410 [Vicinamibacteria bacterium]|nr:hypothetical protein [Vicinamibacteria bacterium]
MGRAQETEAQRILGRYKKLVLLGKARLPLAEARRLVGPDTAFHLYFRHGEDAVRRPSRRRAGSRPRRAGRGRR